MMKTRFQVQEHEAGGWLVLDTETGAISEYATRERAQRDADICNRPIRRMHGPTNQAGLTISEYWEMRDLEDREREDSRYDW